MTYPLTAVIFLSIGFTLGFISKPAESFSVGDADTYPLKESRDA